MDFNFNNLSEVALNELKSLFWEEDDHPRATNGRFTDKVNSLITDSRAFDRSEVAVTADRIIRLTEHHEETINSIMCDKQNYCSDAYRFLFNSLLDNDFKIIKHFDDTNNNLIITKNNLPAYTKLFKEKHNKISNSYIGYGIFTLNKDGVDHECVITCTREPEGLPYAFNIHIVDTEEALQKDE